MLGQSIRALKYLVPLPIGIYAYNQVCHVDNKTEEVNNSSSEYGHRGLYDAHKFKSVVKRDHFVLYPGYNKIPDGVHHDTNFNPDNKTPETIYFTQADKFPKIIPNIKSNKYIREVHIPDDALVHAEFFRYRADKLVIDSQIKFGDWSIWHDNDYCKEILELDGTLFSYVKSPTDAMMLDYIKLNPKHVRDIPNISDDCIIKAIKNNYEVIAYVRHPNDEMKLAAVRKNPNALDLINNPTNEMIMIALNRYPSMITSVKNPTNDMKLFVLNKNGKLIKHIRNPTHEMKMIAVGNNAGALQYIDDQTDEMKWIGLDGHGSAIQYIKNPTDEMKLRAVKDYGYAITYIDNSTIEMKKIALKKDPRVYHYITVTSEILQEWEHAKNVMTEDMLRHWDP
jgi:hypothetical protein